jgi:DNA-formamidopyrimidine glycosylase
MPEGPEVYTISKKLHQKLAGKRIKELIFLPSSKYYNKPLELPSSEILKKVYYYGKKIVFCFESYYLVSFLGMTGSWNYQESERTSAKLMFEDLILYYEDYRKFGLFNICKSEEELKSVFKNIGKDYIIDNITLDDFEKEITKPRKKKTILCKFLLNQKIFAGIGNYLRADIMYLACLKPDRQLGDLTNEEIKKLYESIYIIMNESVKKGGLTISDYWDPEGTKGSYDTLIYGKKRDLNDKEIIKSKFDDRTTHWVPSVQI